MIWLCYIIMLVVPYLLAGINTSIIVARIKTGKDIRTMGSGNAGLTNTLRVLGKGAAGIVLLGDVAKAAIAVLIVRLSFLYIGGVNTMNSASEMTWVEFMAVFMAIVGHCLHTARHIYSSRGDNKICFARQLRSFGVLLYRGSAVRVFCRP